MNPETLVLGSRALYEMDNYANLLIASSRCQCGCGATIVELYRSNPLNVKETTCVVVASGANVFEALIAAHAQLLQSIDAYKAGVQEITDLEELFNAPAHGESTEEPADG